jgi:MarR family transcriptional regulator, transcriptional regulator for hemolysin
MATNTKHDADAAAERFLTDTDRFVFLLEDVTSRLRRNFDSSVEQFGLTRTQWRTLAYVYRTPGMTQTQLAKRLDLERASIGQAIDRLEKMELVERRSAKNDRRVWHVHLLPAAIELLPALRKEADATYERLLSGLGLNDLERFGKALAKMRENLDLD